MAVTLKVSGVSCLRRLGEIHPGGLFSLMQSGTTPVTERFVNIVPGDHWKVKELVPLVALAPPNSSIAEEGPEGLDTAFVDPEDETLEPCCSLPLRLSNASHKEVRAGAIAVIAD